jgi:uncharacterized protein YoxC
MDKLSKEELLKLLANAEKPRKQRKKPDMDTEKKMEMLERLASMRETVKKNREAKKELIQTDVQVKEKDIDAVFEKKYGSKFEKMAELLTDLNENTKEVVKMKKEKIAKREAKEKQPEPEIKLEVKETLAKPAPPPVTLAIPQKAFPNPNLPIFSKGRTRF